MENKYGFNFLWMFAKFEKDTKPTAPNLRELDFIAEKGFNFVRVPTDYKFWTKDFDYLNPDEKIFETFIDVYLDECTKRGLHMSLNIHRAPGYCVNRNDLEKHSLWTDKEALDGFIFLWEHFAKRYKGISNDLISFDLVNEPPHIGRHGCTRDAHEKVIRETIAAIRKIDPTREIVINGLACGHTALPELADAEVIHSGRGYQPFQVSHHKAQWIDDWENMEPPVYPGILDGMNWDRTALAESYKEWREVEAEGVKIHIGEFGCFNKTPNDMALRWLSDLMGCWKDFGWGYAMWNFKGPFGICDHGRPDARFEKLNGFNIDVELLDLMLNNRRRKK
ncbi:MAG: cellulase family glycosylhydrolase [Defluviitaleaceae bacterium]|nr:cellulase family glycosylhydrolase [Defluviitaleaceae bacterium]